MRFLFVVFVVALSSCSSQPPATEDAGNTPLAPLSCDAPLRACGTDCADVATDSANCGQCGHACAAGEACAQGLCYVTACASHPCGPRQICLDDVCVDSACIGIVCPGDQACAGGGCYPRDCTATACSGDSVCVAETCVEAACVGVVCPAGLRCAEGICRQDTCSDGVKNGDETGSDCGGYCTPCSPGSGCMRALDCTSLSCDAGICQAASCTDGSRNGTESDVDCGAGTLCPPCGDGRLCTAGSQCATGVCTNGRCQAGSCTDGVKNGSETDTDCGGGCTARCGDKRSCALPTDCASGVCLGGRCAPITCVNNTKDGDETDVDCGGSCPGCGTGRACLAPEDCASIVCSNVKICVAASCVDMVKNGNEADTDCGGSTCPRCPDGRVCRSNPDCTSSSCVGMRCATPSCTDSIKNGGETGPDCGGDGGCVACPAGAGCFVGTDCTSRECDAGSCSPFGLFQPPLLLGGGTSPEDVVVADLDKDSRVDIAVVNRGSFDVNIWFSNGDGTFAVGPTLQIGGGFGGRGPQSLAVADVNGDTIPDLINVHDGVQGNACSGTSFSGCITNIFRGVGMRGFLIGTQQYFPKSVMPGFTGCGPRIAGADIDRDGLEDLLVGDGNAGAGTCGEGADSTGGYYMRITDGGTLETPRLLPASGPMVASGDLNGDGLPDMLSRSFSTSSLNVFINNADGGFRTPISGAVAPGAGEIVLARVDGDNILDVVVASKSSGRVGVARGLGDGNLLSPNSYPSASPDGVAVADFDGDGRQDVAVGALGIEVLTGNGDGTLNAAIRYQQAALGDVFDIATSDFNGDGHPDLVVVAGGRVYVLLNARP